MSATSRRVSWFGKALLAGILFCNVPFGAKADLITYPLSFSPGTVLAGFPPPYGTVTVDRSDDAHAHITFTAGSSGGFNYFFVGQFMGSIGGNGIDHTAVAVNVNAPFNDPDFPFPFGTGNAVVVPAPNHFPPPVVSSFGGDGNFIGAGIGGVMNAAVAIELGTFGIDPLFFPMQSIAFDIENFAASKFPWASAGQVLTPNAQGFLAAAGFIGCAVNGPCSANNGILVGFSAANGPAVEPVPEPASLALVATGLLTLLRLPRSAGVPGRGSSDR